ncbi:MAG: helix-turn-helix transcriptional regulator [Proteobacteria bacterium]|nr:helix-turn-helix transcriptional regulator [Pseudomonadota bacterium]
MSNYYQKLILVLKTRYSSAYGLFLAKIKAARNEAGLTQAQLAAVLQKPQSFIAKVEAGERRIDIVEFIYLAAAMKIDPAKFISELEQNFPLRPRDKKLHKSK